MSEPELVLRTAAVLVMLALAGLVLASRRHDHTPRLGAAFVLAVAAFVVTSAPDADAWLGRWVYPLTALCVAKGALFWLFAKGLFADGFRIRPVHAAAIVVTMGYGSWQQLAFAARAQLGLAGAGETVFAAGFEVLILGFVLLALGEALRGLAGDLVERRRRLRIVFVLGVSAYLAAAVLVQGYNVATGGRTALPVVLANLALIATAGAAATWNLVQPRAPSWLDPDPAGVVPTLAPTEQRVLAALQRLIQEQHAYRQEGLTIGSLAQLLGTREHVLRRVINQGLGYRNFNEFLHAHRIREACERLRNPDDARLPVLSIALGVGYGSIGPFNRAFKALVGTTPTRFRQRA